MAWLTMPGDLVFGVDEKMPRATLLMIGNYLSSPRHNRNVWHSLADRLAADGWSVITTSSREGQLFRLMDMLVTILREKNRYALAQIDVFSGRAFIFAELCSNLLNMLKKPVVLTLHGGRLPEFARQNPGRVLRLLKRAQVVVTPSPFLQQALKQYHQDIRFIPNPIKLEYYQYRKRIQADPNLIWVRSFHSIYNPSLPVSALKILMLDFPNIRLTMIGPDKGDGSLGRMLKQAEALEVRDQIQIIAGIPHAEIPVHLDRNDIFINSSNYDTAPRSLLEAMANGLCIVSTNIGGVPWLVEDELEALLVPPGDPPAMAAAVRRILVEPGLAARLSENARRKSESYDWPMILPQWEKLFSGLIRANNGKI
jgi:glycosyltransferase involved in cell wall biosynthesis